MRSFAIALLVVVGAATSQAVTLSYNMTVDNQFSVYLSDSATTYGTFIGSGDNWQALSTGSGTVPVGGGYLHVRATNTGGPAMFLGDFTLTDGYTFDNGTSMTTTNRTDWTAVWPNTFAPLSVVDQGANGSSPWGTFPGINSATRYIWVGGGVADVLFTARITSPVPEPASMLALGFGLVAFAKRKKAK